MTVNEVPTINSVRHALRCIDLLAAQPGPVGLSVISDGLGLPRATTLRVLNTLIAQGYVWKDQRRYALTLHLLTLAGRLTRGRVVDIAAAAALDRLVERTGLTAHLVMLDGTCVHYLAKSDPPGPLPMTSYVGWRGPLHATAAGKILLAQLTPQERAARVPAALDSFTSHTLTSREALETAVTTAAQDGYALDDEELMPGLRCLAVAVPDSTHLAVSLSGPLSRVTPRRLPRLLEAMREAGQDLIPLTPGNPGVG